MFKILEVIRNQVPVLLLPLAKQPRTSDVTSLSPSLLTCDVRVMRVPASYGRICKMGITNWGHEYPSHKLTKVQC